MADKKMEWPKDLKCATCLHWDGFCCNCEALEASLEHFFCPPHDFGCIHHEMCPEKFFLHKRDEWEHPIILCSTSLVEIPVQKPIAHVRLSLGVAPIYHLTWERRTFSVIPVDGWGHAVMIEDIEKLAMTHNGSLDPNSIVEIAVCRLTWSCESIPVPESLFPPAPR